LKTVYLVSGQGGMFVNFVCSLICLDKNYGSVSADKFLIGDNNAYTADFIDLQTYFKEQSRGNIFPELTDNFKQQLSEHTQKYNLVLHTHYYLPKKVPLENSKQVNFYVTPGQTFLPYLMFMIKVLSNMHTLTDESLVRSVAKQYQDTSKIKLGQTVSRLSLEAWAVGQDEETYLFNSYKLYKKIVVANITYSQWDYLNVHDLLFNTDMVNDQWQTYFDMAEPFDKQLIREYNKTNFELIEQIFECKYEDLLKGKWYEAFMRFAKKYRTPIEFDN